MAVKNKKYKRKKTCKWLIRCSLWFMAVVLVVLFGGIFTKKLLLLCMNQKQVRTVGETIVLADCKPPTLILQGSPSVEIMEGSIYEEEGALAYDDFEGDISGRIEIESTVDTSRQGTYEVIYHVSDLSGNESELRRIVTVTENIGSDVIYLTFDDGPSSRVTEKVLDVLDRNDVKATFFIVDYKEESIPLLNRMVEQGHAIGIHTYSHDYSVCYANDEAYVSGVEHMIQKVQKDTGYTPYCIRFPGGGSNTVSEKYSPGIMSRLAISTKEHGWKYYDWNVDSTDAAGIHRPVGAIVSNVTTGLKKGRGNIVLCHDSDAKETTVMALQEIIDYGKKNGYQFAPITPGTEEVHHKIEN